MRNSCSRGCLRHRQRRSSLASARAVVGVHAGHALVARHRARLRRLAAQPPHLLVPVRLAARAGRSPRCPGPAPRVASATRSAALRSACSVLRRSVRSMTTPNSSGGWLAGLDARMRQHVAHAAVGAQDAESARRGLVAAGGPAGEAAPHVAARSAGCT